MSKNIDTTTAAPSAKRKPRRKAGAGGNAAEPRVKKPGPGRPRNTVAAPRLAAFLAAIPEVCGVFGMDPARASAAPSPSCAWCPPSRTPRVWRRCWTC